jgi:hypothetical protein
MPLRPIYWAVKLRSGVKGILSAAPDQRLTTAYLGAGHPGRPKEKLVASRPLLKSPVELTELPGEGIMQIQVVPIISAFRGQGRTQFAHTWLGKTGTYWGFERVLLIEEVSNSFS